MKIAFLTPEYPHPKLNKSGGIGTSILGLTKALKAKGHDIRVLVYGQQEDGYFVENGIAFYLVKNIKLKGLSLFLTQKKVERLINQLYASGKIDIVEAPDWTGFTAFVNPKCPLVIRENGSDTYFCYLDERPVKLKNKLLEQRALKNADGIISVSAFTGKLTNTLFGLKRDFTVIPNGVNARDFKPKNEENASLTILYFGTVIRKKGVLELAEIFNRVHNQNKQVQFILAGHDSPDIKTGASSTWSIMQSLFSKEAIAQVHYIGPLNYSEVQGMIQKATICVFPSFAEALPVSWLEAMAMEKAIVASNIGWAKEMISDGAEGYLVHPTAHDLYAQRILELLADKEKRNQFGVRARAKVLSHFDSDLIAENSVDFYQSILNS